MESRALGPINVRWGAAALGALFALGVQLLLGRIQASLWVGPAEPDTGVILLGMLASLIAPLVGALLAVRAAALANVRGAYLHGMASFALFLVASTLLASLSGPGPGSWAAFAPGVPGAGWVTLCALLGIAGALVGSAVARRQVLGQPAFRASDFYLRRGGERSSGPSLRRLLHREPRATPPAAPRSTPPAPPRPLDDDPRGPLH